PEKPSTAFLDVRAVGGLVVKVKGTRTSGPHVAAAVEELEPGKHWKVRITVKPDVSSGQFKGWAHLLTDDKGEYRVIGIAIVGQVEGAGAAAGASPAPPVQKSHLVTPGQ